MKKLLVRCALVALVLASSIVSPAAATRLKAVALNPAASAAPPADLWREIDEAEVVAKRFDERVIVPQQYRVFSVDETELTDTLASAPEEFSAAAKASGGLVMTLPMPDGSLERFRVQESSVMEPQLQAQFPDIRTYIAQGIDDRAASVRLDHTPLGFHAQILSPNGTVYIDPYFKNGSGTYITYFKRDYTRATNFQCLVTDEDSPADKASSVRTPSGATLRTYRLAITAAGDYTASVGGTVPQALATITTTVNRVNGVYEIELAVRLVLVANESSIIFTNAGTDPFTNPGNTTTTFNQNQSTIDTNIGTANYDIGHLFIGNGGGVATLGSVCNAASKAKALTGLDPPVGDGFDIDFVAHEMGHQFAGSHTFNGTVGNCSGGNRTATSAYEVGSGSTIQAYAGICGSDDLQPHSDAYFHTRSFDQMTAFTTTGSGNCPTPVATGNNPPVIDAGPAFTIPRGTPFELTAASYGDPNGDDLTFCWEEFDLGAAGSGATDDGSAPILRSYNPSTSPTRVFPRISNLIANTFPKGEVLPTTNRTMTFRCTARDNRAGGGGVDYDSTTVTSSTSAGPFAVTAPNAATTFGGGTSQSVSWSVAGTNGAPVNCANVSIFLSIDGGNTFPICLLANTPNDGTENITIPNVATTTARIKVKGAGNIFFDISNANFTITAGVNGGDSAGIWDLTSSANFLRNSNSAGSADTVFGYGPGPSTFVPLVGDWDGNHTDTAGLYDPTTGFFFLRNANSGGTADLVFSFGPGGAGIVPLRGDWNGDGVDTIGIYIQATGSFFLRNANSSGPADIVFSFGPGGSFRPLTGDWNADGTDSIGLYDVTTGFFFLRNSNTSGLAHLVFSFGSGGDTPIVGDWNLDGRDTVGIYLPASGSWFLRNTNASGAADVFFGFGPAGATPIVGDWDGL